MRWSFIAVSDEDEQAKMAWRRWKRQVRRMREKSRRKNRVTFRRTNGFRGQTSLAVVASDAHLLADSSDNEQAGKL